MREQAKVFFDTFGRDDDELVIKAISRVICSKFGVSEKVIRRRIQSEKLWTGFLSED
jgi:hypothetical protein